MTASIEAEEINMTADERTRWGPFSPAISHAEMLSRLRVLRAFVQCFVHPLDPIHDALWAAESGEAEDLELARLEFDRLPALRQRDVLAAYARHWKYTAKREPKPAPAPASEEWR